MPDPAVFIRVDGFQQLQALINAFAQSPEKMARLKTLALSATGRQGKTAAARDVQKDINLKYGEILDTISWSSGPDSGDLAIKRKAAPLIDFIGTRQASPGVSVLVNRQNGREILVSTFIQTMKTGYQGVFVRTSQASDDDSGPPRVPRLPIIQKYGATVAGHVGNDPETQTEISGDLESLLLKNTLSRLKFVFGSDSIPGA